MKYSGKHICLQIGEITFAVEASIDKGKIKIEQYFKINTEDFFVDGEISSIEKLIKTICSDLNNHNVSTKKVMIMSDCLGIGTEIMEKDRQIPWYKKDVKEIFKEKAEEIEIEKISKIKLGKCIKDGDEKNFWLVGKMEKELSNSIYEEFSKNGFKIVSIEDRVSAGLNLRSLVKCTYEENCKVVINVQKEKATVFWCKGDIPFDVRVWGLSDAESIGFQIENYMIRDLRALRLKRPGIIIIGCDKETTDFLRANEWNVLEIMPLVDADEEFEDKYIPVLSLLFKVYYSSSINLTYHKKKYTQAEKIKSLRITTCVSCFLFIIASTYLCAGTYDYLTKLKAVDKLPDETEIEGKTAELEAMKNTNNRLSLIDMQMVEMLDFVTRQENIFIASIDSIHMLPQITIEDEAVNSETMVDETLLEKIPLIEKEEKSEKNSIIIRGYTNEPGAVTKVHNTLVQDNVFTVLLNGVEKIPDLPLYAFEIEVS